MRTAIKLLSIAALAITFVSPAIAKDDKHDKWIDVLSIDWGSHQPGASTSMGDGNYKDKKGRYIIVRKGKVVSRGWDYKKKKPVVYKPQDGVEPDAEKPKRIKPAPQEGIEPDEIDNK